MSAKTFLSSGAWTQLERVLPLERWFCKQREGLGYEAWTYAMIRVVRAHTILQWVFDETKLDGVSTMNQWVLLQEGDNAPEVVTIEAAGLTVGGTAKQTAEHVQKSWDLGQQAVLRVHAELPSLARMFAMSLCVWKGEAFCSTKFRGPCMTPVRRQI
jgi:hypothetical protein